MALVERAFLCYNGVVTSESAPSIVGRGQPIAYDNASPVRRAWFRRDNLTGGRTGVFAWQGMTP